MVNDRHRALATLRVAAAARMRTVSPATPLGLRLGGERGGGNDAGGDEDAPTCPQHIVIDPPERGLDGLDEPPPLPPPPRACVAFDSDQRRAEQATRLRERLGAVAPALTRLRAELARAGVRVDRPLLEPALADVTRGLVPRSLLREVR